MYATTSDVTSGLVWKRLLLGHSDVLALPLHLDPAQQTASVRPIATLDFLAVSNGHSAIALVTPSQLLAGQSGGPMVTNGVATRGRAIIGDTIRSCSGWPTAVTVSFK